MTTQFETSSMLTTEQAAQFVGVKPDTLDQWRYRGRGPSYAKVGGAIRYKYGDLMKWIAERTVAAS